MPIGTLVSTEAVVPLRGRVKTGRHKRFAIDGSLARLGVALGEGSRGCRLGTDTT